MESRWNKKIGMSEREAAILQFNSVQVAASATFRCYQGNFCIRFNVVESPPVLDFNMAGPFVASPIDGYTCNSFRETSTTVCKSWFKFWHTSKMSAAEVYIQV